MHNLDWWKIRTKIPDLILTVRNAVNEYPSYRAVQLVKTKALLSGHASNVFAINDIKRYYTVVIQ